MTWRSPTTWWSAGSAGSIIAERLSADPRNQVAVLEVGGKNTDRRIRTPVTWTQLFRGPIDWDYVTEPQPELNGRRIYWPRGKTLGGSSSTNAMFWIRGFAADYDEWAEHAGEQWSFHRIVKYFKQIERVEGASEPDEELFNVGHVHSSLGGQNGSASTDSSRLDSKISSDYALPRVRERAVSGRLESTGRKAFSTGGGRLWMSMRR